MLVDDIMDILEAQHDTEIPSTAIGDGVMVQLRKIDHVAYVRFASVYKEFRDVSEFMQEIKTLGPKPPESSV
jgi:transcriptional repressor NrdR